MELCRALPHCRQMQMAKGCVQVQALLQQWEVPQSTLIKQVSTSTHNICTPSYTAEALSQQYSLITVTWPLSRLAEAQE